MPTTPGVYFEHVDRGRPAIGPLRTDIAGFVGYAERGPLLAPAKITGWRQFTAIFGEPLSYAHLGYSVRGFFDNGGAACYVVRIADRQATTGAREASVTVRDQSGEGDALLLWASHGVLLDPMTQKPQTGAGSTPIRYASPGGWGNRLAVSIHPAGLGNTVARPDAEAGTDGHTSYLESLSGFQVGSIVRLSQDGGISGAYRCIAAIDPQLRAVTWDASIASLGLQPAKPVRVESVEFTLLVLLDGQVAERHANLSLSARHSRYITRVLQAESRLLDGRMLVGTDSLAMDPPQDPEPCPAAILDPQRWPATVERLALSGGRDGLANVRKDDFLAGLNALAEVDEVSLLAAPDAVLELTAPPPIRTPQRQASCDDLLPPDGRLQGRVVERTDAGDVPLADVAVTPVNAAASSVVTDGAGEFTLINLPVGLVALRLQKDGYLPLETTSEARPAASVVAPARFELTRISLPPSLAADDIFDVQSAMLRQGEQRLYRVALLDPPASMLSLDAIQTWRARFDSSFAALYYPWLMVEGSASGNAPEGGTLRGGSLRATPPSGHIAGLIAATDLAQGVHRAPANYVLNGVKALSHELDDAQQGILNPLGINCLRVLPGRGIRVFGARTVSSDPEWRYLNVRRLLLMIEEAIEDANQWAVFEPNNPVLRQALSFSLNSFLHALWRAGALAGDSPAAAFTVQCNDTTTPSALSDAGQVVAEIGVAPVVPFEFITFRLGRTVEAIEVKE